MSNALHPLHNFVPVSFMTQPRVLSVLGNLPEKFFELPEEIVNQIGKITYRFISFIQSTDIPDDGTQTEEMQQAAERMYDDLLKLADVMFTDNKQPLALFQVAVPHSPFVFIFGQGNFTTEGSEESINAKWVLQYIEQPNSDQLQEMGQVVLVGVSQSLEDRHPGIMEKAAKGVMTVTDILEIIESDIQLKS